jgi:hypothetical protein
MRNHVEGGGIMAVTVVHARPLMGQWVEAHSHFGVHRGILHQIRSDGIVIAVPRGGGAGLASGQADGKVEHAHKPTDPKFENVFTPFVNPFFFFLPFFTLLALSPFLWW